MLTTCPHCGTRFRVTAKQLKAAQGQVRCGKCDEVFDAEAALQGAAPAPAADETLDVALKVETESTPELEQPMAAEAAAVEAPDIKAKGRKAELPPIDDLFAGILEELTAENAPAEETPPAPAEPLFQAEARPLPSSTTDAPPEMYFVPAEDLPAPPPPKPKRPLVNAGWWLGIVVLALLLLGQLVNANRDSLSQNMLFGASLQALYAALGHPLTRPVSVQDWDVSGLNVTSDPDAPGSLSITGSLANQAGFVQPWPSLRVVLTDRYGDTLRARDFKPTDYLAANQASLPLGAGQVARFRLDVVDPGADAVGFTLAPCLDVADGRVCAAPDHD